MTPAQLLEFRARLSRIRNRLALTHDGIAFEGGERVGRISGLLDAADVVREDHPDLSDLADHLEELAEAQLLKLGSEPN